MGSCSAFFRREFRLSKFGFSGVRAERFCKSQWRIPVSVYLAYRFLLMGYVVFWLGYTSAFHGTPPQAWGAYLTNWTYVMLTIYLIAHFFAATIYHGLALSRRNYVGRSGQYCCSLPDPNNHAQMFVEVGSGIQDSESYEDIPGSENPAQVGVVMAASRPPWYLCVVWVLFNVISAAALMVTIVFFSFLFHGLPDYPNINLENLQVHLLNSVIILIEHCITAAPYRLLHLIYPFIYGLIYMFFSVIYWAGDHSRVMYPDILDWNKPGPTVVYVLVIGFVIIPVLHLFFFLLHKAKMALFRRLCL